MSDEALQDSLWDGCLAIVDGIHKGVYQSNPAGGTARSIAHKESFDDTLITHCTYRVGQEDGTDVIYEISVNVTKRISSNDDFWNPSRGVRKNDDPTKRVVVNNEHYLIVTEDTGFKGFGGREWRIKFHDGRRIDCSNLWYQGVIPPAWREVYANNAVFLADGEE